MKNCKRIIEINTGLGNDYNNIMSFVIDGIQERISFRYLDIGTAIKAVMLDYTVENADFYDCLKPYYNKNYNLIPDIGIDGVMNLAVENHLTEFMVDNKDAVGKAIAFDYMIDKSDDNSSYQEEELMKYIENIVPSSYTTLEDMLVEVDIALEVYKKEEEKKKCSGCNNCTCGKKKVKTVTSPDNIRVFVLDNSNERNDLLSLLKILNGEN